MTKLRYKLLNKIPINVYGRQPTQRVSPLGAFQAKRKKGWNPTNFIPWSPSPAKWLHLLEPSRPGLEWTSSHQCSSSSRFDNEPKTHPLPLPRDFSAPFSAPKFSFPTYFPPLLPTYPLYLPHLIFHSFHFQSMGELPTLNSIELWGDMKHKAWGRWRAQHWRNVEKRKQEECFIPIVEVREER
jgi:hypothetical protein